MNTETEMLAKNQIWIENDPRFPESLRLKMIVRVTSDYVTIHKCDENGIRLPRSPDRQCKRERFDGRKGGYSPFKQHGGSND